MAHQPKVPALSNSRRGLRNRLPTLFGASFCSNCMTPTRMQTCFAESSTRTSPESRAQSPEPRVRGRTDPGLSKYLQATLDALNARIRDFAGQGTTLTAESPPRLSRLEPVPVPGMQQVFASRHTEAHR